MYWLPAILILPYFFLLLKISSNLRKIKPFPVTSAPSTFVSVIIACRNEQERLPALLESLSGQDYPNELFEVIIVDDNSSDKTFIIASEFKSNFSIRVLKNNGAGKKAAISTGINSSGGELIVTTDADCTFRCGWITNIAAYFEINHPDIIISPVKLGGNGGFFSRFQELEFLGLQGITAGTAASGNGIMCNGANLAYTREAYLRNKGNLRSDINSGDDVFLLHSLKKESGSKILWLESREALVTSKTSSTLTSFLSQRRRWITKWNTYNDSYTIIIGLITFIAVLGQLFMSLAIFFNFSIIAPLVAGLILKSVPDFLILRNTTARYGETKLMRWFIPAQLVYPFYVAGVVLYSQSRNSLLNYCGVWFR
jgi:poly-beta-1,6-N-acetyl-D-glucosamine synthase